MESFQKITEDWDSYDWKTKGPDLLGTDEEMRSTEDAIREAFDACRKEIADGDQYAEHYAHQRFRHAVNGWAYWDTDDAGYLVQDLLAQERKVRRGEADEETLPPLLDALCNYENPEFAEAHQSGQPKK